MLNFKITPSMCFLYNIGYIFVNADAKNIISLQFHFVELDSVLENNVLIVMYKILLRNSGMCFSFYCFYFFQFIF